MDTVTAPTGTVLRYRVGGMDCPSCAGKIETALNRLGGARGVRVNHQTGLLVLELDELATSRDRIEAQVRSLGFDIRLADVPAVEGAAIGSRETGPRTEPSWWASAKVRQLIAIGVLLLGGVAACWILPAYGGRTAVPAALFGLWIFGRRAIALARAGSPFSIEMLMSVATVGAILIGAPTEAAIVVLLFTLGELLEGIAAGRARAGIRALAALAPRTAMLVEAETAREVPAASLQIGQKVLVRPGDRVPTDGLVVEGVSELDESPVTGESVPVPREEGDTVIAGSINGSGALQIRVTRTAADNTVARIVHMVEEAQARRAPTARFIERFSAVYTPTVMAVATLAAVLPPLLFGADWGTWIYRGLALLLIGCPCALVLSTPAAITSGIAAAARRGLLVKGGAALETIGHVRTVAFDKTGTLTCGRPEVTDIVTLSGNERVVLGLAASVENGSNHPLAHAILARAGADGIPLRPATQVRSLPGQAMSAKIAGKVVTVGSPRYVAGIVALPADVAGAIAALEDLGKTVVVVISDSTAVGIIAVRDEPRDDAVSGLAALRKLGIQAVMLTGDNPRTAKAIAVALAIDVRSGLLPADKLGEIAAFKAAGPVAMVGDGINDAPALAAASVGIAMGGGTDVALETADAAILGNHVGDVARLVHLSRATMRNIRQNVAVAIGLKAVFLVTTLVGLTGLWPAVLSDTGATVLVTLNAMRLLRHRFE
jgi:Zn2+/Cd2+-exporting ATPase